MKTSLIMDILADKSKWGCVDLRGEKHELVRAVQKSLKSFAPIPADAFANNPIQLIDFFCGFRVIIVIEANSYVNIRSSRLLPKFKTQKINSWCAA